MPLTSMLVYTDRGVSAKSTLKIATGLAERHDAQIVGLAVRQTQLPPMGFVEIVPQDVMDSIAAQADETVRILHDDFADAVQRAGLTEKCEWRSAAGDPASQIVLHGRYSDLIIVGQADSNATSGIATEIADDVVLEAGRPVLVVPYAMKDATTGNRPLVAWNGSREAARALVDALPFLKSADAVNVVSADPEDLGDIPGADIGRFLAHHGVKVDVSHSVSEGLGIGDELLNRVSDLNADMLVMGAYGHSRFRETVLGGATRHILKHMTVPTLLSH